MLRRVGASRLRRVGASRLTLVCSIACAGGKIAGAGRPNTTKTARLTSIVRSVPTRSKVHDHVQPFYSDARPGRYAASAAWHERARRQGPISEEIRSRLSETGRDPAYRLRGAGVSPHRRRRHLKSGTHHLSRDLLADLLRERFRLRFHMDSKIRPIYSLRAGNNGPRLKPTERRADGATEPSVGGLDTDGCPIVSPTTREWSASVSPA